MLNKDELILAIVNMLVDECGLVNVDDVVGSINQVISDVSIGINDVVSVADRCMGLRYNPDHTVEAV